MNACGSLNPSPCGCSFVYVLYISRNLFSNCWSSTNAWYKPLKIIMCYLVGLGNNKTSGCKRSTSFGWPGLLQNLYNSPSIKSFNSPGTKLTTIFLITRKRKLCSHYYALRSTHVVGKTFWIGALQTILREFFVVLSLLYIYIKMRCREKFLNRSFANYFKGILWCFVII